MYPCASNNKFKVKFDIYCNNMIKLKKYLASLYVKDIQETTIISISTYTREIFRKQFSQI